MRVESNPGTSDVEAELDEGTDDQDTDEVKPDSKKNAKKKRLIAPIRIKLTKIPVSQKLKALVRQSLLW